jgi:murein DD-endopeptidase MepM/ murein hydrolase activator NlpD
VADITDGTDRLGRRAVAGFRRSVDGQAVPGVDLRRLTADQALSTVRRARLFASAVKVGQADLDRLDGLRDRLNQEGDLLVDRLFEARQNLRRAERLVTEAEDGIVAAEVELATFRAGSEVFIDGVRFPIEGTYSFPLIDSFGFPRMTGTADEHWHEGIDIFAPRGTPLVAVERGVVLKVGTGRLGGRKFWIKGESGTEWYYAHLDAFAPGLVNGLVVEAGDLVGYVGDTGNAVGTPPHLHLQMHPDGGRPVNPFPLLNVVAEREQATLADGTHPGWRHQPAPGRLASATGDDG